MDSCDTERLIVHQDESTAAMPTPMPMPPSPRERRQLRLRRNTVPRSARNNLDEEAPSSQDSGNWNHSMTFDGQVFLSKLRGRAEAAAGAALNGNWDYFL